MPGAKAGAASRSHPALYAGFALTGVVTPLLGPLLPYATAAWRIDDATAGSLFTAQFAGSLAGLALSSFVVRRAGYVRLLVAGFALVATGLFGLAGGSWLAGLVSVFVYGLGLSLTIPTINLYVSDANPTRRAEALNLLNFIWCVGAISGPFVVDLLARHGLAWPLGLLGATSIAIAAWSATIPRTAKPAAAEPAPSVSWRSAGAVLLLVSAMAYFYVGAENGIVGWVATHALRQPGAPEIAGAVAISAFWGCLLAGRLVAPAMLRRARAPRLVLTSLVVATAGAAALPLAAGWPTVVAGAAVAGLGLAIVFPTTLAFFTEYFDERASRIAPLVFACASLGGATIPLAVGRLSTSYGGLAAGLLVPLGACVAMVLLQLGLLAAERRDSRG